MKQINCPICGSCKHKLLFTAKDYSFGQSKEFNLVECLECHLAYLNPQPEDKELSAFYPIEFFKPPEDKVRLKMPEFMLFNRAKETKRLKNTGTLLDIGCGSAIYLKKLQSEGWTVHGLDNSDLACQIAAENIGKANVFQGNLFNAGLLQKKYDVITLWHAIEHLPDPVSLLKFCRNLLKDDGVLIIACPNFGSLLQKLFKKQWYPLMAPSHLLQFKYPVLKRLLIQSGYKIVLRKKHFIDPFTNMGSLKISLMRFLGFGNLTTVAPITTESQVNNKKEALLWRITRSLVNALCFTGSMFLSLVGNEEIILVWAAKELENNG